VQLSGGEQQRVALARAFMNSPKILFCDEPTGNLDGDTARAMVELIFGLNRERSTTLVLVTHDLDLARRCHRLIRLKGGLVISDEMTEGSDSERQGLADAVEAAKAKAREKAKNPNFYQEADEA
jgi:ABC-type lipoprotein export system ATPase subunit